MAGKPGGGGCFARAGSGGRGQVRGADAGDGRSFGCSGKRLRRERGSFGGPVAGLLMSSATLPSLSQVQGLNTTYLAAAAGYWTHTATLWERAFTEVHGGMSNPGGTPWTGRAAGAAQERAYADVVAVRGASDCLHEAASIARRGEEQLKAYRDGVLEAVHEAQTDGFDVGEDYSVTDRSSCAEVRAARRGAAQGHAAFIRHRVAALVAGDQQLSQRIAAVTNGIGELTFQHAPAIQLVDNRWKEKPPQPIPPDPEPGPLPPINNADDVRRVLDPLQNGGKRGPNGVGKEPEVKELWDTATIKRAWDYLTRNAVDAPGPPTYRGKVRVLPDGTQIGIRQSSDGWGDTLDVWYPDRERWKIHTPYSWPTISPPPQLPPATQPLPSPLPPAQVGHPPVTLPPTQVVDPVMLPPWLQNPSPPGFQVAPSAPLPIAPIDLPDTLALPAPPGPTPMSGGSSPLPNLAHDLAEGGKVAGSAVLAGVALLGALLAGGLDPSGQIGR